MNEESMKTVYYERKPGDLSENSRRELEALAAMPDEAIDYSDIPKQNPKDWENAKCFHDVFPTGKTVMLRLDRDISAWLEASGPGSDAMANRVLRERMTAERGTAAQAQQAGRETA